MQSMVASYISYLKLAKTYVEPEAVTLKFLCMAAHKKENKPKFPSDQIFKLSQ